jgi:general secretion pathway protein L
MATLKALLTSDVADIAAMLRPAWQWWKEEITSLLPSRVRQKLLPDRKYFAVQYTEEKLSALPSSLEIAATDQAPAVVRSRRSADSHVMQRADASFDGTVISLLPSQLIKLQTHYPRASPANLRRMIGLDLPRLCPLDPTLIYFGFKTHSHSVPSSTLQNVEIWICRREVIDRILELCESLELRPIGVTAAEAAPQYLLTNILSPRKRTWRVRLWSLRRPALAALAAILMALIAVATQVREAEFNKALESELSQKKTIVQALEKDRAKIQGLERRRDFLLRQRQATQAGQVLSELARILPDDAWIYNLEYARNEVRVRGFAQRANELIPALDASPLLSGAQFRAPIIGAPGGGGDRFDIAVKAGGVK